MHSRIFGLIAATALAFAGAAATADDMNAMQMSGPKMSTAASTGYRFELMGAPAHGGAGKSIVAVRLVHNGKPVVGAIIIKNRADMGPIGMAEMTAPIKALGERPPGIYRFEISNGPVWNKPDKWSLSFSAKVQGEAKTVTGSVVVKLAP